MLLPGRVGADARSTPFSCGDCHASCCDWGHADARAGNVHPASHRVRYADGDRHLAPDANTVAVSNCYADGDRDCYSHRNADADADADGNGGGHAYDNAYGDLDGYANRYGYGDRDRYGYADANCHSHRTAAHRHAYGHRNGYCYANADAHRDGYRDANGNAGALAVGRTVLWPGGAGDHDQRPGLCRVCPVLFLLGAARRPDRG
jgi:hypothetical protein